MLVANRIPQAIRTKLGDDAAFGMIAMLDCEEKRWSEHVLTTATDRFERQLIEEMGLLRQEFHSSLYGGLSSIRAELASTRVETLRWSFLFSIGQVAAVAALLAFILRSWRP